MEPPSDKWWQVRRTRDVRPARANIEQHRDRWWQFSLRNLLLSVALFGVSLALAKACLYLSSSPSIPSVAIFGTLAAAFGSFTFLCAAAGSLAGRFKQGAAAGMVVSLLTFIAFAPLFSLVLLGALVFIFFAAIIILDWHP